MTKTIALDNFRQYYYQSLNKNRLSNGLEKLSRREAWKEYTSHLFNNDLITLNQYFNWVNPFNYDTCSIF